MWSRLGAMCGQGERGKKLTGEGGKGGHAAGEMDVKIRTNVFHERYKTIIGRAGGGRVKPINGDLGKKIRRDAATYGQKVLIELRKITAEGKGVLD